MPKTKAVEYEHEIRQVKTLVDGSTNVLFNIPIHCKEQAVWLFREVGEVGVSHKSVTVRVETKEELKDDDYGL